MKFRDFAAIFLLCSTACAGGTTQPAEDANAAWCRSVLVDGYEKSGTKDDSWNEPARRAAEKLAVIWSRENSEYGDEYDTLYWDGKAAVELHCTDPVVLYATARDREYFSRNVKEWYPLHYAAADNILKTSYHPFVKCMALIRAAICKDRDKTDAKGKEHAQTYRDAAFALMPEIAADAEIPRSQLFAMFSLLHDASKFGDPEKFCGQVYACFERGHKNRSDNLTLMEKFYSEYAWDARGGGYADSITPEKERLMQTRLAIAEKAGEAAWQLDNTNAYAAVTMMRIEQLQSRGNGRMDQWYQRAVQADPSHTSEAHLFKLADLQPKWHGTFDDMIKFSREFVQHPDQDPSSPLTIVSAYLMISRYTPDGEKTRPQRGFFARYPAAWKDISPVYEKYINEHPDVVYHRCRYAQLALWCHQPEVADAQFRILGDKYSAAVFDNLAGYQRAKSEVEEMLKENTEQK